MVPVPFKYPSVNIVNCAVIQNKNIRHADKTLMCGHGTPFAFISSAMKNTNMSFDMLRSTI